MLLVVEVEKRGWIPILVRTETYEKLIKLRSEMKLNSLNDVISKLIDMYRMYSRSDQKTETNEVKA